MPAFTPLVRSLPPTVPFVGPEEHERRRGRPFAARIGANESVFGPSPLAVEAMRDAAPEAWKYADPLSHQLRVALARGLDLAEDAIRVGEGIDGLLGPVVRLFVQPGDAVVTSAGAYPTFNYHVAGFGGRLTACPYRDDAEDPDALAAAARRERARLVYLANPDNPMGSWHEAATVKALLDALPPDCLLVLDEAYLEFAPPQMALPLDPDDKRLIRLRTFSKAYGLAGLRIGYAIGHPDLLSGLDRIRNHFGVNRQAQVAAQAAFADTAWLREVRAKVEWARSEIGRIAGANGLAALPSAANFVAVDCGRDGSFARKVLDGLLARDVFVRMPSVAPLDRCIRVTAGTRADMALFAEALPAALRQAEESAA